MNNNKYIASDGTVLTDALVERLAGEAEQGFPNSELTPVTGRPWEAPREPMRSHAIRMPDSLWELIKRDADRQGMSASDWARQTLASALVK